jgi:transposase
MNEITASMKVLAIDLAKHVFQAAGEDGRGVVVWEARIGSRDAFWALVQQLPPGLEVVMEAGSGAQAWAREMQSRGASVRLLPAQRVGEHRSGAKNDRNDALALLRAGRDSAIHAVPIKSAERLAMQAVHRTRSGYVRRRTSVGNQIRGLLLEHGVAMAKGNAPLVACLTRVLGDASVPLPILLRELIADLWAEWTHLGERIERLSAQVASLVRSDPMAQRLMTIPGIGPITASALVCKELTHERFADARQFAASFGLVPDQHSSGGKTRLGDMSKRGDRYIRSLLIQGAHAVLVRVQPAEQDTEHDRLRRWVRRHGRKGAAIRLANRNLRIVWRLLRDDTTYCHEAR